MERLTMTSTEERIAIKPRFKLWLEIYRDNSKTILGKGKIDILSAIDEEGSIKGAADRLGLNFKTTWKKSSEIRREDPDFLMEVSKGGSSKGGTILTPFGHQLVETYGKLEKAISKTIESHDLTLETGIKASALINKVSNEEKGKIVLQLELPRFIQVSLPDTVPVVQNMTAGQEIRVELDIKLVVNPDASGD